MTDIVGYVAGSARTCPDCGLHVVDAINSRTREVYPHDCKGVKEMVAELTEKEKHGRRLHHADGKHVTTSYIAGASGECGYCGCWVEIGTHHSCTVPLSDAVTTTTILGWTCPQCGQFVPHDERHECPAGCTYEPQEDDPETYISGPPVSPWVRAATLELTRIAVAMERIIELLGEINVWVDLATREARDGK